jgi:RecJ-like exonuclease
MQDEYDDYYDDPYEDDENFVVCDECNGDGEVNCYCAGDFCCCPNGGEKPCPVCGGEFGTEGYITREHAERREAAHREMMARLWGNPTPKDAGDSQ